jgi:uncharacterized cupredoxin-like copper-binding protein
MRARVVLAVALAMAVLPACTSGPRTITVDMKYSHFLPVALSVFPGETVRFRLVNEDPITHEFILGTEAVQLQHERGSDENHDGNPGQATLSPGETQVVSFTFGSSGSLIFGCHRPGHYTYGMRGTVKIA